MTAYCIKVLDADPGIVTVAYSLCSITAPIPGAAMGGYLADKNVCNSYIKCFRVDTKEKTF